MSSPWIPVFDSGGVDQFVFPLRVGVICNFILGRLGQEIGFPEQVPGDCIPLGFGFC